MITELKSTSPASLRAVFSFGQPRQVRIELDIHLTGGHDVAESHWAEIARIIDANHYHQRLDPVCRECDWYQVLNLIRRCHEAARFASCHLSTSIRIEDGDGASRELQSRSKLSQRRAAVGAAITE
jgi:uncharacterized protein YqgV (UPF0045/DUF77 family)